MEEYRRFVIDISDMVDGYKKDEDVMDLYMRLEAISEYIHNWNLIKPKEEEIENG